MVDVAELRDDYLYADEEGLHDLAVSWRLPQSCPQPSLRCSARLERNADQSLGLDALPLNVMQGKRACQATLLAVVCAALFVSGADASGTRVVTVYSIATGVQYINTADDRARGQVNNPLDSATNKLAPKSAGTGNGPFPGDVAVYALNLYSDPVLKRNAGSAVYTCYFGYARRALCQAYYVLNPAGTLVASGPIDFNTTGFTIVVTGGTKQYLGARGEVRVTAAAKNAQRVDFQLIT